MTRRLYAQFLPVLLVTMALSACAFDPPSMERVPREAAATESNAKSRVARRGAPAAQGELAIPGEEIEVPGEEVAALEVDLTNFKERLIGLDSDEISDLMGAPGLERAEPPALIWQYRGTVCTVDIFMFDDGGGSTVDHVEVRGQADKGGEKVDEKACFTGLLRNSAALAPSKPVTSKPVAAPVAPARTTGRGAAAQPSRAAPAAPAAASRGTTRTPTPRASTTPEPVVPAEPVKREGPEFEDDDNGPPPGAAAGAPRKDIFEIEDDPDKMDGPVRNEDDPAATNEDLVE